MVRWEPGARERLRAAALDLYVSRGYEQVTAAEIAQSVGLTERTFFRHFADKREVLFDGQEQLRLIVVDGVASASEDASAMDAVAAAFDASAEFFPDDRRPFSRVRQGIIVANPVLQERELLKMASLARAIAAALTERGIPEPLATLAAESGVTVFGVAFRQWIADGEERDFLTIERDTFRTLRILTGQQA